MLCIRSRILSWRKVSQISRGWRRFYKQRKIVYFTKVLKALFFLKWIPNWKNLQILCKTLAWFSHNSVALISTIKDVSSIKITTSGRDTSGKSQGHIIIFMTRILFYFCFFFITFCIKLKSFFSLQHTLSCESDVKEVERVGQKTVTSQYLTSLQSSKGWEVEKRVDLHLTAVYYNKGERQKRHTPKNLTVHSSLHSQTQVQS